MDIREVTDAELAAMSEADLIAAGVWHKARVEEHRAQRLRVRRVLEARQVTADVRREVDRLSPEAREYLARPQAVELVGEPAEAKE